MCTNATNVRKTNAINVRQSTNATNVTESTNATIVSMTGFYDTTDSRLQDTNDIFVDFMTLLCPRMPQMSEKQMIQISENPQMPQMLA